MQTEIWKDIDGQPGYQVSSFGHVRSFYKRCGKGTWVISKTPQRTLRPSRTTPMKYLGVNLRGTYIKIHTLVARAFLGERPNGLEVCHNDGDARNNRVENLRYDTHQSNMRDARSLSPSEVLSARQEASESRVTYAALGKKYGVGHTTMNNICLGVKYSDCDGPLFDESRNRPLPSSKLTYSDADNIRARYATGERQCDLAQEYGVHFTQISHIVHNRRLVAPGAPIVEPRKQWTLTKQKRDELVARLKSGENRAELAKEYGISHSYTYHLCPISVR